jgi:putative DNA primase/helicase
MRFEKALLLYGAKRSSKSTVLFVLSNLLGEENVTNMTLHFLNENKFGLAYLYGAKANICADLPTEALKSISKFMLITGRDRITCDKKGKDPTSFYSIAKPVFSCNQIPRIPVKEDAFYRRWIILNFPYSTPLEEVDEHYKTDLLNEISGILNWAIKGTKRVLKNHGIYYNKTEEDVKDIWNKNSDTVTSFVHNKIVIDDFGKELMRNVYNMYIEYCKENKLRPENNWIFGRVFKLETGCGTCRINKIPAYAGIKLKNTYISDGTDEKDKKNNLEDYS